MTRLSYPLLAGIFLAGGADAARHPSKRVPQADPVVRRVLAPLGVQVDTATAVRANGVAQVAAAALLAANRLPRVAAGILLGSLVPTTLAGHAFWDEKDPARRAGQRIQFLKNLGVLGGLLLVAVPTRRRTPTPTDPA
ncbi:MAG TPA: DoxX family protein [Acidimicrobiales bacterium]|nr:DoxX family protein [Acidimicrobiales bacterium]